MPFNLDVLLFHVATSLAARLTLAQTTVRSWLSGRSLKGRSAR
jgi:hypothetical protein